MAPFQPTRNAISTAVVAIVVFATAVQSQSLSSIQEPILRGHWAEVVRRCDELTASDPTTRILIAHHKTFALEQLGKETDAISLLEKILKDLPPAKKPKGSKAVAKKESNELESARALVQLDLARIMLSQSKKRTAGLAGIEELSRATQSDIAPAALYLLAVERNRSKNIDGAAMAFNLSREAYPNAVGEEQLIDLLAGDDNDTDAVPTQPRKNAATADESASRATNTRYAIQLGVFSAKTNADALLIKISSKKFPGSIEKKIISGKTYFAALMGSFLNLADAQHVRDSLEIAHDGSFTVITR